MQARARLVHLQTLRILKVRVILRLQGAPGVRCRLRHRRLQERIAFMDMLKPVHPIYAYIAATLMSSICWYGLNFEVTPNGWQLHYGPMARLALWIASPVVEGFRLQVPEPAITTSILAWPLLFICARTGIAAWNFIGRLR